MRRHTIIALVIIGLLVSFSGTARAKPQHHVRPQPHAVAGWARYSAGVWVHWSFKTYVDLDSLRDPPKAAVQKLLTERYAARQRAISLHKTWIKKVAAQRARAAQQPRTTSSSFVATQYSGSIPDLIRSIFSRDAPGYTNIGLCVAGIETGGQFDPTATNPYSGAAGIFQWMPYRWPSVSKEWGFAGASAYDAVANITVSARVMEHGGLWNWSGDGPKCGF